MQIKQRIESKLSELSLKSSTTKSFETAISTSNSTDTIISDRKEPSTTPISGQPIESDQSLALNNSISESDEQTFMTVSEKITDEYLESQTLTSSASNDDHLMVGLNNNPIQSSVSNANETLNDRISKLYREEKIIEIDGLMIVSSQVNPVNKLEPKFSENLQAKISAKQLNPIKVNDYLLNKVLNGVNLVLAAFYPLPTTGFIETNLFG